MCLLYSPFIRLLPLPSKNSPSFFSPTFSLLTSLHLTSPYCPNLLLFLPPISSLNTPPFTSPLFLLLPQELPFTSSTITFKPLTSPSFFYYPSFTSLLSLRLIPLSLIFRSHSPFPSPHFATSTSFHYHPSPYSLLISLSFLLIPPVLPLFPLP